MREDLTKGVLHLTDVTMMEAVANLRQNAFYIQFEREQLDDQNTDWSRSVVDSCRRFSVSLSLDQSVDQVLDVLIHADMEYDWIQLTRNPVSYWIFPRSKRGGRFASSAMAWKVGLVSTGGRSLFELLYQDLRLQEHQIQVFDRANFLSQITSAPEVRTEGRLLFEVLGRLFARSGKQIVWTLGGLGNARVLSIGMLPVS